VSCQQKQNLTVAPAKRFNKLFYDVCSGEYVEAFEGNGPNEKNQHPGSDSECATWQHIPYFLPLNRLITIKARRTLVISDQIATAIKRRIPAIGMRYSMLSLQEALR
jgi:hypothetical protein